MTDQDTILYIEDNLDNQRLVQRILESRGYHVIIAVDGTQGVALAREINPALVLVDLGIPGLDGYETTTRLRSLAHLASTPIVALTAHSDPGTRERSLAAGCDGYILKPIDVRLLPEQVSEFISGKREILPANVETTVLREYTHKLVERLEQQVRDLSAANAELQELDRLKSQFLALLSHELRTPLTSILGYIELFDRGYLGALSDVQRDAITVIGRNSHTLVRHLNSLLYLQEVRSTQLKRVPVAVDELLKRLLVEVEARAKLQHVTVQAMVPPVPLWNVDALAMEMALRHVLENALKFTPAGGTIQVELQEQGGRLMVRVRDDGPGIDAEQHEKIFVPFYQVDSSLAREYSGVGIGLPIVKHVIEAHGGQVTVKSAPGEGALFTLLLPG